MIFFFLQKGPLQKDKLLSWKDSHIFHQQNDHFVFPAFWWTEFHNKFNFDFFSYTELWKVIWQSWKRSVLLFNRSFIMTKICSKIHYNYCLKIKIRQFHKVLELQFQLETLQNEWEFSLSACAIKSVLRRLLSRVSQHALVKL